GGRIFFERNGRASSKAERACHAPERADWFRVSAVPFARRSHGLREPRDPAVVSPLQQKRARRISGGCARPVSDRWEKGFVSASAIGWTTASRRCCPGNNR